MNRAASNLRAGPVSLVKKQLNMILSGTETGAIA